VVEKKYELLANEVVAVRGQRVYRVRALRDFGDVKVGQLGGYIKSEANLSHEGNAWVGDDAKVFDRAVVFGDAQVADEALVFGDARVGDQALVYKFAQVYGRARIYCDAQVLDNARVFGDAQIGGQSLIGNHSLVGGHQIIVQIDANMASGKPAAPAP
jgi:UDP-3-O-[3-hydroxymyristoyl] glucosamine N-acyltransferase